MSANSGASGENAAEQVKGGLKGLNNLSEGIRNNVNAFADDLLGNNHKSTGFSGDAKLAGKEVEQKVSGDKSEDHTHTTPAGTSVGSHGGHETTHTTPAGTNAGSHVTDPVHDTQPTGRTL